MEKDKEYIPEENIQKDETPFLSDTLLGPNNDVQEAIRAVSNDSAVLTKVRTFINSFDPKNDRYKDSFEAQAYVAARYSKSQSLVTIARNMGMNYNEFDYYMNSRPEFAAAVRKGIMDGKEYMKESLVNAIYEAAVGKVSENTHRVVKIQDKVQRDGSIAPFTTDTTTTTTSITPPNPTAAIELLKRIDPTTWQEKATMDINVNGTVMNVTPNEIVNVDYRKLSPEALKELLGCEKSVRDSTILKREDGTSILDKLPSKQPDYQGRHYRVPNDTRSYKWTPEKREKIAAAKAKTKAKREAERAKAAEKEAKKTNSKTIKS